ncbi:hypothetical protein AMEX_G23344 [Astyanax mexicanus]|uniref:DUF4657 domain-containing protein n=1 Tax=Astyanax mexicanus TaxID=7994 RepID=A0A8T2KX20_ASTMX|nr:hypothetical protein AMEX_G23344 [Astyanax mexicanus]
MNLYRNFGCMLETWVAHGYPDASSFSEDALEKQQDANSSDSASTCSSRFPGITLRSESEDSGVDLSNVGSPKESRSSVLTSEDFLELKPTSICEITEEDVDVQPSSASPSPSICSSSSSCFSEAQGSQNRSTAEGLSSVEQALKRTRFEFKKTRSLENMLDVRPRRRSNTTSLSRGLHTGLTGPPHSTESDQDSPGHTVQQDDGNSEDLVEGVYGVEPDLDGLSPGLVYLEQMCRMLEQIARLQQKNQNLQVQMDTIRVQNEAASAQKPETSSKFSKRSDPLRLEDPSSLTSNGFRHRTVSDTWAFLKHRRKPKLEKFASTEVLLEEPVGNLEPPVETEPRKKSSSLKQRISSLKKNDKINPSRSSSLHGERSVLNLFRNRRKTTRL